MKENKCDLLNKYEKWKMRNEKLLTQVYVLVIY